MRYSKADLLARINAPLTLRQSDTTLSSFAGLELVRIYVSRLQFVPLMRQRLLRFLPASDYGSTNMVLIVIGMLLCGARRVRHLDQLRHDPIVERFCNLKQLPTSRSVTRWLTRVDADAVEGFRAINEELAGRILKAHALRRVTLDIDGSVLSTGLKTEGAKRGYNPHRRKVPSYYPISAYEANSGVMINVLNRPGNVHDGKASLTFMSDTLAQVARSVEDHVIREMRLDGAFFRKDVLQLLDEHRVQYALKVPMTPWIGVADRIRARTRWYRVDDEVDYFRTKIRLQCWRRTETVTVFRRRVNHKRTKLFQLDLFDSDDGHYEYSAIASNKTLRGPALWKFMNGRGTHEKVYGELKSDLAFAVIPTQCYEANSAWQLLSIITFNITRGMQLSLCDESRARTQKRRTHHLYRQVKTLRRELICKAGLLLNVSGRKILDLGRNETVFNRFIGCQQRLFAAAI